MKRVVHAPLARRLPLAALILCVLLVAYPAEAREIEALRQQAAQAREANRLSVALSLYRKAVTADPDWTEGWWFRGTLAYELDAYGEAVDSLHLVVRARPNSAEAWALLGLSEYQLGRFPEALESLNIATGLGIGEANPVAAVVSFHRGMLLSWNGEFEAANRLLTNLAFTSSYDRAALREALGICVLRLRTLPGQLSPADRRAVLLAGRAIAYVAVNQAEAAGHELEDLVRRYPSMPNVHYLYGSFLIQTEPERALGEYLKELELSPRHLPAHIEIALEYLRVGKFSQALPYARRAVELDGRSFAARNALGRALLEAGDVTAAVRELEEGVRLAPDSPEMYFALSRAYQRAGRAEEAGKAVEEFQRLNALRDKGAPAPKK